MRPRTYTAQMTQNPHFQSAQDEIDLYPRLVGALCGPYEEICGGIVWWSRYQVSAGKRLSVLPPLIGVQIGADRWRVQVSPTGDHLSLSGRWSMHGWEALVEVRPKGRGKDRRADAAVTITGEAFLARSNGRQLPTEYFFPDHPTYVPRAFQAHLP